MLIEFLIEKIENDVFEVLYELRIIGIASIIAHQERYMHKEKNQFYDILV